LEQNWGICNVKVDYLEGHLLITYNPMITSPEKIQKAINSPGYILETPYLEWVIINLKIHRKYIRLGIVTALLLVSWIFFFKSGPEYCLPSKLSYLSSLNLIYIGVNMAVILLALMPRIDSVRKIAETGRSSIDLLIFIATAGAVLSGFWLEAATFLLVMVFAEAFEEMIVRKASHEISVAAIASAKNAYVIEDGTSRKIPVHELRQGQLIDVKQGMIVPVDGIIRSGHGQINESAITGENTFALKAEGDRVYAGTLLESGSVVLEATAIGHDTELGNIIQLIERTGNKRRPKLQTAVDSLTGYLAIMIVCYAIGAFVFLRFFSDMTTIKALEKAVSLLFTACPIALLFCAPAAIHAGLKAAAKVGVLFKDGSVIEYLAKTRALLLDKTGTLTYAKPVVYEAQAFGGYSLNKVIRLAASVESCSFHPLALAVCEYASQEGLEPDKPDKFVELEGAGTCAYIGGKAYRVGAKWMIEKSVPISPPIESWIDESARHGLVTALVANEKEVIGGFRFTDKLREEAPAVLCNLRKLGIEKIVMITGDNISAAKRIAQKLHLDGFHAECMPDIKLEKLEDMRLKSYPVAMIGDGINDAPVLAAADVGIAIAGTGADAAVAAADIALTGNTLTELSLSYSIAKRIFTVIKLNIILALLLNLVMVVLISAGIVNIMTATFLYAACTIFVISNSYLSVLLQRRRA
jgi:Cd2+/Zn2+-exporting ATPase